MQVHLSSQRRQLLAPAIVLALMLALVPPAHADEEPIVVPASGSMVSAAELTAAANEFESVSLDDDGQVTINEQNGPKIVVQPAPEDIRVSAGNYIYVYMTGAEAQRYSGYSFAVFSGIICSIGAISVIGAIACSVLASFLFDILTSMAFNPSTCYEFRFNYVGYPKGHKAVSSSLC